MQEILPIEGKTTRGPVGFLVAAFLVAFSVMVLVPMWFALGVVGSGGAHVHGGVKISQEWFTSKISEQQKKYALPDGSVRIPPGDKVTVTMPDGLMVPTSTSKVYIMARQFSFIPNTIRLQYGGLYDIIFFSPDVLHGGSVIMEGSLNTVILPDMTTKILVRPTKLGEIEIRCTEYCGAAHHLMKAKIIVE
ncbi:MAG: hypothetical protein HYX92_00690 [Chloroflexi bacterium]|nr:hypothetical protein [Chloroflexota bacterium]